MTPDARRNSGTASHEVVVERAAIRGRVGMPHTGRPQVAREADVRLELVGLDIFDQLAAGIELPVVGHAEDATKRVVGRRGEIGCPARGDAPLVFLGTSERHQHPLEVVRVLGRLVHLNAGFLEQVRAVHQRRANRWPLYRQRVNLAVDNTRAPRVVVVMRQVGVILDRVAAQVRRQVGALGLDKAG